MSRSGRIALIAAAIAVAVVAFVLVRSGSDDDGGSAQTTTQRSGATSARRIEVRGGKPVGGVQRISATKGDTMRLVVSSPDTSGEVHLHGYDLKRDVAPGRPASFRFRADAEGAFEIELEDTATKIGNLEVRPR